MVRSDGKRPVSSRLSVDTQWESTRGRGPPRREGREAGCRRRKVPPIGRTSVGDRRRPGVSREEPKAGARSADMLTRGVVAAVSRASAWAKPRVGSLSRGWTRGRKEPAASLTAVGLGMGEPAVPVSGGCAALTRCQAPRAITKSSGCVAPHGVAPVPAAGPVRVLALLRRTVPLWRASLRTVCALGIGWQRGEAVWSAARSPSRAPPAGDTRRRRPS